MDNVRGFKQIGGNAKGRKRTGGAVKGLKRAPGMSHKRNRKGFPGVPAPSRELPTKKETGNNDLDGPLGK